jgi:hypothetical protein
MGKTTISFSDTPLKDDSIFRIGESLFFALFNLKRP